MAGNASGIENPGDLAIPGDRGGYDIVGVNGRANHNQSGNSGDYKFQVGDPEAGRYA